jgi:hypothetical protein
MARQTIKYVVSLDPPERVPWEVWLDDHAVSFVEAVREAERRVDEPIEDH